MGRREELGKVLNTAFIPLEILYSTTINSPKAATIIFKFSFSSNIEHIIIESFPTLKTISITMCNINIEAETTARCAIHTLVNQAAGSTRCAKEGCDNWCVANSRYCSDHQG